MKKKIQKIVIILAWLCLLEVAAMLVNNKILFVGPIEVLKSLAKLMCSVEFYYSCLTSLGKIMLGMLAAFISGTLCGVWIWKSDFLADVFEPVLSVMKSIPVASFVVLLLIWQGAENLSLWISFFVVFPNVCVSMKNGLKATDAQMVEMADVFGVHGYLRALFIYKPTVIAYLISCMEISIGMSFKSGIAAEVIGAPAHTIGERIYASKVYLDTAGLFAWTISMIFLSYLVEKVILYLMKQCKKPIKGKQLFRRSERNGDTRVSDVKKEDRKSDSSHSNSAIEICNLSKAYDNQVIFEKMNVTLKKGGIYMLMSPSGSGKTTLFRIISGLSEADGGNVSGAKAVSYQFQEDRLCENELTINNIMLTAETKEIFSKKADGEGLNHEFNDKSMNDRDIIKEIMCEILPESCIEQAASALSGGMKRRLSLIRAVLYHFDDPNAVCLLDEPFSGLDEETKKKTADFIKKYQNNRTFIIATHDEADADLLGGSVWKMQE